MVAFVVIVFIMNGMSEKKIYYTPKVAAQKLGVDRSTIHRWRHSGKFPDCKRVGNRYMYARASLLRLADGELFEDGDILVSSPS